MMGVSTSKGILTIVARHDKLSCVNDSCLSTASQLTLYKENIRMDHECDGSIHLSGYINHGGKTGQTELC